MVVDTRLCVYCYSSGTSNVTVGVSQAYGEWKSQEVTWATQPMVNGNLDDYVVFKPETGVAQSFSITRMVKEWYETGVNGGLMMRAVKEDGQYTEYVSSDFPIQVKDCRPSVLITYLNNSGLEDYWGNHSQDVGRAGTGYVNATGDVIALVDTGWNTVVSYAYDSWGKVTAIEGDQDLGKKNPLRYRGYYWDEETGLYYLASRYYDPEVGRFISADTIEVLKIQENFDDLNLYSYCNNNSVNYKDPNGNLAIAAGYVVLAVFVVSYVYIASTSFRK